MNPKIAFVGILAVSIAAASATSISVNSVGVMNTNSHTIIDATGSISNTAFASAMATAFANNTGGVLNFDNFPANWAVNVGETITASYGTSLSNSEVLTLGGTQGINQGAVLASEATSSTTALGLPNDASTRTFTLNTPLQSVGVFVGNRGDNTRTSVLTVTFLDNTTASTSGANAGPTAGSNYFEGLSATGTNYIKSFSLSQNAFIRYDDLGFITAVPEPSHYGVAIAGLLGVMIVIRRRRAAQA